MTFLKKMKDTWAPVEFPNAQVGEIIDFPGPYESLVRSGDALLVDKDGNEVELPGQTFECPVCFTKVEGLKDFTDHVSQHMPKPKAEVEEPAKTDEPAKVEEPIKTEEPAKTEEPTVAPDTTKEDALRARRLAALEKARAARLAKMKG